MLAIKIICSILAYLLISTTVFPIFAYLSVIDARTSGFSASFKEKLKFFLEGGDGDEDILALTLSFTFWPIFYIISLGTLFYFLVIRRIVNRIIEWCDKD